MSKITNDGLTRSPVWHTMLYSGTHMATVGVNGQISAHQNRVPAVKGFDTVRRVQGIYETRGRL